MKPSYFLISSSGLFFRPLRNPRVSWCSLACNSIASFLGISWYSLSKYNLCPPFNSTLSSSNSDFTTRYSSTFAGSVCRAIIDC